MSDGGFDDVEVDDVGGGEDVYQETTVEGYGERIKDSIGGICIGILLFFVAFPLLFWNEGRAVERYDTLREGEEQTKSLPSVATLDSANDGQLVHFTVEITSDGGNLTDPLFGVETNDLKLWRRVSMYQWSETKKSTTKKNTGGKKTTTTTYTYNKGWEETLIRSSTFNRQSGHQNPTSFPFPAIKFEAETIYAGAFRLPSQLTSRIDWWTDIDDTYVDPSDIVDNATRQEVTPIGRGYYLGNKTVSNPDVGDVRVMFEVIKPTVVSIIAEQRGDSLVSFQAEAGGSILIFQTGNFTAAELYDQEEAKNATLTWILRLVGFLVMAIGIYLIFRPLEVLADVLPILGDIVSCGIWFVAFFVAGILSGITICIAWLFHHPVIGIVALFSTIVLTCCCAGAYKYFTRSDDDDDDNKNNKLDEDGGESVDIDEADDPEGKQQQQDAGGFGDWKPPNASAPAEEEIAVKL